MRRIPRSPCCPDLLAPDRVLPVHRLPLARAHIEAELELRRLVGHSLAILVDGRLVIPTPSRGDPGGFPV